MESSPRTTSGYTRGGDTGNVVTEQVQQGAQQIAQQTQDAASQVAGQARQQAQSFLEGQKSQATENLNSIAQALRQTSQNLRDQNQGVVSPVPDRAADQIERVSAYLSQRDVNQLVREFEDFARRNSTIFLTGAFALGALAARFLKSSGQSASYTGGYGGGYGGQSRYPSGMDQGFYQYRDVPYAREDIGATPQVDIGYAPGLMGRTGVQTGLDQPSYGATSDIGYTPSADLGPTGSPYSTTPEPVEPAGSTFRPPDFASEEDLRTHDGTSS